MDDPERAFVLFSPSDNYVLLVNNISGTSTTYAIADETLLQLSKIPSSPLTLPGSWQISLKFSDQVWCEIAISCIRWRVHESLNQPGFSLTLLNLTHVSKSASSVEQVISLIDAPHMVGGPLRYGEARRFNIVHGWLDYFRS